jgi:NitT/TauT family transport system permease protein
MYVAKPASHSWQSWCNASADGVVRMEEGWRMSVHASVGECRRPWGCYALRAFCFGPMTDRVKRLDLVTRNGRPKTGRGRRVGQRGLQFALILAGLLLCVAAWEAAVLIGQYSSYILPGPERVYSRFLKLLASQALWMHVGVTLEEVFAGLALGMLTAFSLGYLIARSRGLERIASPYIIASQAIPIVALAPLLVIWFGFGLLSKIVVCALVVFFPLLVNTVVGLRSVERDLRDLMRSLQASRWQTFTMLELPAAMPVVLGGLKIGVTLAVVGAVVGEFVGADRGLGFLVNLGRGLLDTPLMFVAIIVLVVIALILYGLVTALESALLSWRE